MDIKINMNIHLNSIQEIEEFLKYDSGSFHLKITSRKEKYIFINKILNQFKFRRLKKKEKGIVKKYLRKLTGYSEVHLKRLISLWKKGLLLKQSDKKRRGKFLRKYSVKDIKLLIETDKAHGFLNGKTVKKILEREFQVFGKKEYENISQISVSHLYNFRKDKPLYASAVMKYSKTKNTPVDIGERRKPQPDNQPGFLRVDTVHQGDKIVDIKGFRNRKGIYHINLVDEVLQFEIVVCTEKISQLFMNQVLADALEQFPYKIINFHSDNGSEFINGIVSDLLNKNLITQTKSRSRRTNDNALVESKNGAIIRKHLGRNYIDQKHAPLVNEFYKKYFNPYLNYHRVCAFPKLKKDKKGKIRKTYPLENYMTPYDKMKSVPNIEKYLKPGITLKQLDQFAFAKSDNEFAKEMQMAKEKMFRKIQSDNDEGLSRLFAKYSG